MDSGSRQRTTHGSEMERVVFFQLVDAHGQDMGDMDRVRLPHDGIVMDLWEAVNDAYKHTFLRDVAPSDLVVFANCAAFDETRQMHGVDSIGVVGVSYEDPVIVQVPPRQPTVAAPATVVMRPQAPTLRWKSEPDLSSSLASGVLHFVNRDAAVEQLCSVHEEVFNGAATGVRGDAWQIALADNELGLGKTEFGRQYIQRCRDAWPLKRSVGGFQESLCACRTLRIQVDPHEFANAVSASSTDPEGPCPLTATIMRYLADAVVDQLDLSKGATLPDWLASPSKQTHRSFLNALVGELGPIFVVLDEIGEGFTTRKAAVTPATEELAREENARQLFLNFCDDVLKLWLNTKGLYFVLMSYAPYLRNVGERTDSRQHSSSTHTIVRLNLQLIRPPQIEEILRKTWVDSSKTETLADRWKLHSNAAIEGAAQLMYKKTCGHPRTMQMMLNDNGTYEQFVNADVPMSNNDWEAVCRELRTFEPLLREAFLDGILKGETIDLTNEWDCPHPSGESAHKRSISFVTIAERCCFGWEGNVQEAKLYALPRILTAIILIAQPLRKYLRTVSTNADRVTLSNATVFEWACLKRFQELFYEQGSPQHVFPEFFGADTAFGKLDGVQLPDTVLDCPKITKQAGPTTSLNARTAKPKKWSQLMDEIVAILEASSTRSLCIKPLAESSSSDDIFMHRDELTTTGSKRTHGVISPTTLTLGIAVKNYSGTEFGPSALCDERDKFAAMFSNMDASTKERFGKMIIVLIVCSTKYSKSSKRFATRLEAEWCVKTQQEGKSPVTKVHVRGTNEEDPIAETILLNLTTPELRARFFGLGDDPGLALVLEGLL